MATPDDGPKASERDESSDDSSSDSENEGSGSDQAPSQVEWLATSREKRSTAGNRMKNMLANEAAAASAAADDSDLELLFAEDEDDVGFTDDEAARGEDASDVQMDSSSDEEEEGEGKDDDLEGEKELERKEREKKAAARKRKAQEAIPVKFRKKVRIDQPVASAASPSATVPRGAQPPRPRPKKKSERTSWLPSPSEAPTRASERATTRNSKEQLHQQMEERERRRQRQLEIMEKKAKKAEATKKPPMTQAERLAEAAVVEKRNAKSLNRWEEAEKLREEERARKLADMYNRKLEGPVVTFYSGIVELSEGQMKHVGRMVTMEEKAPRKKRQSAAAAAAAAEEAKKAEAPSADSAAAEPSSSAPAADEAHTPSPLPPSGPATVGAGETPSTAPAAPPQTHVLPMITPTAPPVPSEYRTTALAAPNLHVTNAIFMPIGPPLCTSPTLAAPSPQVRPPVVRGLAPPASMLAPPPGATPSMLGGPAASMPGFNTQMSGMARPNILAPPNTPHGPSPLSLPPQTPDTPTGPSLSTPSMAPPPPPPIPRPAVSDTREAPRPSLSVAPPTTPGPTVPPTPATPITPATPATPATPIAQTVQKPAGDTPTESKPLEGKITRSCIILQNFDEEAIKDKQVQTQILFGRKMSKIARPGHAPICAITGHPARYRDRLTGLPFYNSYAYKQIRRLCHGDYRWSSMLGTWAGSGKEAAQGVPPGFLDPALVKKKEETKKGEGEAGGGPSNGEGEGEGVGTTSESAPGGVPPSQSGAAVDEQAAIQAPEGQQPPTNQAQPQPVQPPVQQPPIQQPAV